MTILKLKDNIFGDSTNQTAFLLDSLVSGTCRECLI